MNWLSKLTLTRIQEKLFHLWEEDKAVAGEGSGVLWKWWEWVGSGEFLNDLDYMKGGELQ